MNETYVNKLEHRRRLIDSFINSIYLYDDRMVITFNYKDGSKTITMEEIENSAISSDLTSLAAPRKNVTVDTISMVAFFSFLCGFSDFYINNIYNK
ncbi:MAG: hypothetical protein VZQ55_08535 [Ruminococcus sp.]|nr:hypothetical protein [Ruminococcus sp.]